MSKETLSSQHYTLIHFLKVINRIKINDEITIDRVRYSDYEDIIENNIILEMFRPTTTELGRYYKFSSKEKRQNTKNDFFLTTIITDKLNVDKAILLTLLICLKANYWKYELQRNKALRQWATLDRSEQPMPPIIQITEYRRKMLQEFFMKTAKLKTEKIALYSLQRWHDAITRERKIDALTDCISALEAGSGLTGKIPIAICCATQYKKKMRNHVFDIVSSAYQNRNNWLHDGKNIDISEYEIAELITITGEFLKNSLLSGFERKNVGEIIKSIF